MPKRFCQCVSCSYCHNQGGTHGVLFDIALTNSTKCPGCHNANQQQRNQRQPTAGRGYGTGHQAKRAELLGRFQPGDPCAICGKPMFFPRALDLAHNEDRSGWLGLAHARCNRATNTGR
jgi:hypothetical protein